jgi:hypothetical protein
MLLFVLPIDAFSRSTLKNQVVVAVEPKKPLVSYYPVLAAKFGAAAVKVICEGRPISRCFNPIFFCDLLLDTAPFSLLAVTSQLASAHLGLMPKIHSCDSAESLDLEEDFGLDVVLL